jgi:glutathione S-transferase
VLTLYFKSNCPHSLRARLILAEKLLPFSRRVVKQDEPPSELIDLAAGPLPVLVDGSFAVGDSLVIADYLEEAYPKPAFRPFDARGRAVILAAMRRIDAELTEPIEYIANRKLTSTDKDVDLEDLGERFSTWEHKLGTNGLLFGMEFSLADVWLISVVERAMALGHDLIARFPNLERWLTRMSERASVRAERLGS